MPSPAHKSELLDFLDFEITDRKIEYTIITRHETEHFERQLICYAGSEADEIRAFLFIPKQKVIIGSVLVHHQHHGERHLGKSEVAGISGDPYQAFCPALASKGILCLAPDSICFEDRRTNQQGIEPDPDDPDNDWLQHYNEMAYRLLRGTTLMKKVIDDSAIGISLLAHLDLASRANLGILGHSYGGNTVIFHVPFDLRISHACSSGAVCSYRTKIRHQTGIELAEVIPGFLLKYEIEDLLQLVCPRKLLMVSAENDKYAQDAIEIFHVVKKEYQNAAAECALTSNHYPGGHALTQERFDDIINWFVDEFQKNLK